MFLYGTVCAALLLRSADVRSTRSNLRNAIPRAAIYGAMVFATIILGATTIALSRGLAIQRIANFGVNDVGRIEIFKPALAMAWKYFPIGSGVGSLMDVYFIDEPNSLLDQSYVNHVHNDWLEMLVTGGFPALIVMVFVLACIVRAFVKLRSDTPASQSEKSFKWMALCVLVGLLAASVGDYPLRTPSLSAVAMIAVLWLWGGSHKGQSDSTAANPVEKIL